jgi:transketolase
VVIPIFPDAKVVERAIETSFLGRKLVLEMTSRAKASHVGSCLSVIDILANLYSGSADISFETADSTERDRIILSKGHAAAALYSVLALKGFMSESSLSEYCLDGSPLSGHATHKQNIGVELSTGSLGHGLPYGAGIALGLKQQGNFVNRVFVIISEAQ